MNLVSVSFAIAMLRHLMSKFSKLLHLLMAFKIDTTKIMLLSIQLNWIFENVFFLTIIEAIFMRILTFVTVNRLFE